MKYSMRGAAVALLVLTFGAAGLTKLFAPDLFLEQFTHFGLPGWWIMMTGAVELLGAALVAFRSPTRRFGAAMLAATMAVATALHLLHDPIALVVPAAALLLLAGYVASTEPGRLVRAPAGA